MSQLNEMFSAHMGRPEGYEVLPGRQDLQDIRREAVRTGRLRKAASWCYLVTSTTFGGAVLLLGGSFIL